MTKYYEVTLKGGHVSKKYYIPFCAYIKAENGRQAAQKGRKLARTKHDHKDAVLNVREITYAEFYQGMEDNKNDPYLKCKNTQEQEEIFDQIKDRLVPDEHYEEEKRKKIKPISYKKFILRYVARIIPEEEMCYA